LTGVDPVSETKSNTVAQTFNSKQAINTKVNNTKVNTKVNNSKDNNNSNNKIKLNKKKNENKKNNGKNSSEKNLFQILSLVSAQALVVICLTETWLNKSILDAELFCSNYSVVLMDRPSKNDGGVLIAVRSNLVFEQLTPSPDNLEQLWLTVIDSGFKMHVGCIYILPGSSTEMYMSHAEFLLEILSSFDLGDAIFLCGDFNLPNLRWKRKIGI